MVTFPNCKINLGLHVVAKRADGYHDLETVFYPLALKDALEIIPAKTLSFQTSGLAINGAAENNLCVKAWQLLKCYFTELPPVSIHLHKVIPMGAGLGGGSSDAVFMLQMLNHTFTLGISHQQLATYALQLGSDCPFFMHNKPCLATGRGEVLTPVPVDISRFTIVVVFPAIHVSTSSAFSQLQPSWPAKPIKEIISQPVETWQQELKNDFEPVVFANHPQIGFIKTTLYHSGATYASMTGSGSAVFGLFTSRPTLPAFKGCETFIV